MKVLRARLYELELRKREAEQAKQEDAKKDIGWGSQIRSYVLQPYRMVKDHRTGVDGRRRRRRSSTATSTPSSRPSSRARSPAPRTATPPSRPVLSQLFPRTTAVAKRSAPR